MRIGVRHAITVLILGGSGLLHAQTINVSPLTVNFAQTVYTNGSTAKGVTITNTGTTNLQIGNVTLSNQYGRVPMQSNNCAASNFTLSPGQSCIMGISFHPLLNGSLKGFVNIEHNDPGVPSPLVVQLSGKGVPTATPKPSKLDFGTVAVGATSTAKTVDIRNNSTVTAGIGVAATGDFAVTPNGCSTVSPGEICTVSVTFKPTVSGQIEGSLGIFEAAAVPAVSLSGTGSGTVQSPVTFTPASINFGKQFQGLTDGAPRVMTLKNTSANSITINGVANSDFGVYVLGPQTTCIAGVIVSPGGTCEIAVKFYTPPSLVPGNYYGAIAVSDSNSSSPHVFAVSGIDAANPIAAPVSLSFALTPVGGISAPKTVKLTNDNPDEITMDFTIGADYNVASSTCPVPPATLAPGHSCALMVEFRPTVVGTPNGALNESLSLHCFAVHRGETGFNNVNLVGRSQ